MAKEKKITIKHIVNTSYKPVEQMGKKLYPLYLRVSYDRKNTQLMIFDKSGQRILHEGENHKIVENIVELLKGQCNPIYYDKEILTRLLRSEIMSWESEFTLVGLSDRIINYSEPITSGFSSRIWSELHDILGDIITYNQYLTAFNIADSDDFITLYLHVKKIKNDFRQQILGKSENDIVIALHFLIYCHGKELYWYDWGRGNIGKDFFDFLNSFAESPEKYKKNLPDKLIEMLKDFPLKSERAEEYSTSFLKLKALDYIWH